jgi:hypothetical protein
MAGREQALGLGGAQALTKAGAERQAYEQSLLEAPLKQASNVSALLRNYNVPTTVTQTFVGPKPGAYGMSPLQSILGIGSLLGSAQQGSLLGSLGSAIGGRLFGPGGGGGGTGSADPGGGMGSYEDQAAINDYIAGLTDSGGFSTNPDDYAWDF